MVTSVFKGIKVAGIATAVPKKKENIMKKYGPKFGEEAVEQFSKTTGVRERYVMAKKQTASDLAYVSARELLKKKSVDTSEVGVLVFVTQSPDYHVPATACVLHKRLGLSNECIAFDVNLGCSGYVYGIQIVNSLLQTTNAKYGLLLVGDASNRGISPEDKSAVMLFGESGSATLLQKTKEKTEIKTLYRTDGSGFKAIITPAGGHRIPKASRKRTVWGDGNVRSDYDLYMNGVDVFSFTITEVPRIIKDFFEKFGTNQEDYDSFVFHQANCYILKQVMKRSKLPKEKVPISMDRYGNTSVTSIPLTICDAYGKDEADEKVRCFSCGFGIGLSWGIVDFEVNKKDIYPIMISGEYYEEGTVSHE